MHTKYLIRTNIRFLNLGDIITWSPLADFGTDILNYVLGETLGRNISYGLFSVLIIRAFLPSHATKYCLLIILGNKAFKNDYELTYAESFSSPISLIMSFKELSILEPDELPSFQ